MNKPVEKQINEKQGNPEEVKLEDILNSIRGIINDHKHVDLVQEEESQDEEFFEEEDLQEEGFNDQSSVLELTEEVEFQKKSTESSKHIISDSVAKRSAEIINNFVDVASSEAIMENKDSELEIMMRKFMQPMLREWLDRNLPDIVEKIVSDEIKKLAPKR